MKLLVFFHFDLMNMLVPVPCFFLPGCISGNVLRGTYNGENGVLQVAVQNSETSKNIQKILENSFFGINKQIFSK